MIRVALFWTTASGIMMAAGLLPTPSSKNIPEFTMPEFSVSEFSVPEINLPDQPTLMENLSNFAQNLPKLGRRSDDPVARVNPSPVAEAPQLPEATKVTVVAQSEVAEDTVHFDLDDIELDDQARDQLNTFAEWLRANPATEIGIFGHTDLTGPEDYNEALGRRRADRVAAYLIKTGISVEQISVIKSFGEKVPMMDTEETSRDNRRVKIETIKRL